MDFERRGHPRAREETGAARRRIGYLDVGGEPLLVQIHEPPSGTPRRMPVLLCPPYGWQEISSYRPRWEWAQTLAADGHPTARIDLPGTGDSGGLPLDHGRFERWVAAVSCAAGWLLEKEAVDDRVAGVGMGLGGLLLTLAAADGAPLHDLVLWGAPSSGRSLARELRAFARVEGGRDEDVTPLRPPPDGALLSAGFLTSAETLDRLRAADVSALAPRRAPTRALLLERDGMSVDERLRGALEHAGADVSVAPGEGFAEMLMTEPHDAVLPASVVERVREWLDVDAASPARRDEQKPRSADGRLEPCARLRVGAAAVTERPLTIARPDGQLVGILAEPETTARELTVVLLNAGVQRRIGPNRMWVEAARRWAAAGVPTLRIDLAGIGDSDGDSTPLAVPAASYQAVFIDQVRDVLDVLDREGLPSRFLLAGLCSGAYWSFGAVEQDERVVAAALVNPAALVWDDWIVTRRQAQRFRGHLARAETYRRIVTGDVPVRRVIETARGLLERVPTTASRLLRRRARSAALRADSPDALAGVLDTITARGARVLMVFSAGEPLLRELRQQGWLGQSQRWPDVEVVELSPGQIGNGGTPDTHTLRPLGLQQRVHALLDAEVRRALDGVVGEPGTTASSGVEERRPRAAEPFGRSEPS